MGRNGREHIQEKKETTNITKKLRDDQSYILILSKFLLSRLVIYL
jgi:hypothetical protein